MKSLVPAGVFAFLFPMGCAVAALAQPAAPNPAPIPGDRGPAAPGAALPGQLLAQGDKNSDQKLSPEEFLTLAGAWFEALDPDRAGARDPGGIPAAFRREFAIAPPRARLELVSGADAAGVAPPSPARAQASASGSPPTSIATARSRGQGCNWK